MATYTLTTLQNKIKRRIRQIRATTDADTEAEAGYLVSNSAITDAINAARKKLMVVLINAELWGRAEATFQTSANKQEYALGEGVLRIDGVQYDVDSDGDRNSNTVDAVDVIDRKGEEACIKYPSNQPSATNPKYRVTNKGIRLIVSADGTVTASKYIRVEYLKELSDLSSGGDYSGLPGTLDEMAINYAIYLLCLHALPQVAQIAYDDFRSQVIQMNTQERTVKFRR